MARKIYKYPIDVESTVELELPLDAELLRADIQNGVLCLWAIVDPSAPTEKRRFRIYGTGHDIDEQAGEYLNTFFMAGGNLVFHFFEERSA